MYIPNSPRAALHFALNAALAIAVFSGSITLSGCASKPEVVAAPVAAAPKAVIAIEGHNDNVGSLPSNQQISDARAKVVRDALLTRGVPAERLKAEGFAFQRPVVSNTNEEGRALNRRVDIIILDE